MKAHTEATAKTYADGEPSSTDDAGSGGASTVNMSKRLMNGYDAERLEQNDVCRMWWIQFVAITKKIMPSVLMGHLSRLLVGSLWYRTVEGTRFCLE